MEVNVAHNSLGGQRGRIVMTVLGPISPEELGITSCHEHLLIDASGLFLDSDYDHIVFEEELLVEELKPFREAGGRTVVSLSNIGLGRNPLGLKRIAEASGVNIVMGSGWYRSEVYPPYVWQKSADELATMIVQEVVGGVDDTGVRAGIIGEIGTGRKYITPEEERVLRAVARAHLQTGAPIYTHTTHFGELGLEQLSILEEEGVDVSRVIIGHLGDRRGIETILRIAEKGAWLGIDNIGWLTYTRDEQRLENICKLVGAGYLDRILLGTDICRNSSLQYYGGKGYDYLLKTFVQLLRNGGLTDQEIDMMLVANPREALSFELHQ